MNKLCAITGANGFIGSYCNDYLLKRGYRTIKLVRTPADSSSVYFDLLDGINSSIFDGTESLIHCAYDFRPKTWREIYRVNVEGSRTLFRVAKAGGVKKIIFISSVSAFKGCRSLYGRAKLEIEKMATQENALIIRPGLVYGDQERGMYGALCKMARFPVLPVFSGGRQPLVLVHIDDLAKLIETMITYDGDTPDQPIVAACPQFILFRDLLALLGRRRGRDIVFFSIPGRMAWFALYALERLGLDLSFRSDSLVGLLNPSESHNFSFSDRFGVTYRSFLDWSRP